MKKYHIVFIILLPFLLFTAASCNKALIESPQSAISPNDFFKTSDQCVQATNGVYSHLPGIFGQENLWGITMAGTDLFMFHGGSTSITSIQQYNFSASSSANSQGIWNSCYSSIKDANFTISRITNATIDDAIKSRLLGENKFLRALYYYILTNTFGDVPLWTDELNISDVSQLPRSPVTDVSKQIIADLQDAINSLPSSYDASDVGRATKGAALSLLAKVYLFSKDWQNAYNTATQVIGSNQYHLLPNYADLFSPLDANKNNTESIFEIQFKRDAASNQDYVVNYFYTWFFPLADATGGTYCGVNFGGTNMESYNEFYPTQHIVDLYNANDQRRDVVLAWGYNGQTFTRGPVAGRPWFGPKFWDLTANHRSSEKDLYFLRYADIIMTLAEAANELGKTGEAITQLNKIEERAGLPDLNNNMNQSQLRSFIMDERAREFAGEFQRKWDLSRWGTLVTAMQATVAENAAGAANVKPFNALFPIPFDEIVKNAKLTQNEGYK